jgi:hypothetical protein
MNYFMVLIGTLKVILASEGWNKNVRHQIVICYFGSCVWEGGYKNPQDN